MQLSPAARRRNAICGCGEPDGRQSNEEQGFEVRGQLRRAAPCRGLIEEARRIVSPELGKRYSNIHDLTQWLAQPRRGRAGMEAHSCNDRAARHAGENGPGVRAGDAECFAGPNDSRDAPSNGASCCHSTARSREVVDPQAANVPAQRRVRRRLAIDAGEL